MIYALMALDEGKGLGWFSLVCAFMVWLMMVRYAHREHYLCMEDAHSCITSVEGSPDDTRFSSAFNTKETAS